MAQGRGASMSFSIVLVLVFFLVNECEFDLPPPLKLPCVSSYLLQKLHKLSLKRNTCTRCRTPELMRVTHFTQGAALS